MTIGLLDCLQAIYKYGTIKKAAKELHCSPVYLYDLIPNESMVYFLVSGDRIKIGTTTGKNCIKRLQILGRHNPHDSFVAHIVFGDTKKEREFHTRYQGYRINGEWFEATPIMRDMGINQND